MIEWEKELDRLLKSNFKEPDPFRKINSEIVLYGAGAMGKMAIDIMKTVNTKPKYIVDKTFEGKLFGIKVIKPHEIPECDRDKATFVISISSIPVEPIFDFLKGLGCKDIRHFYDYSEIAFPKAMPNGWVKKDISEEDIDGIKHTFKALEHNDFSVAHYLQFLWWRLKREEVLFQDHPVLSGKKFFKSQCMPKLTDHECLLDGGAHFGQTVKDFINKTAGNFDKIVAFEPDEYNMQVLEKSVPFNEKIYLRVEAISEKCGDASFQSSLGYASKLGNNGNQRVRTVTIDSQPDIAPSIIKLHTEGDELRGLLGANKTIAEYRPILMVFADHSCDGLYKIAKYLGSLINYKLYFYLHDYCGNSAVFYAIPNHI